MSSEFFSYLKLACFILVSGSFFVLSDNLIVHVVALGILVFGALSTVQWDLSHPYSWYSMVFFLYSIGYPIMYFNSITYDVYVMTESLMLCQWMALVTFLCVVSPRKIDYANLRTLGDRLVSSKPILVIAALMVFIAVLEVSTGGYSHKRDIYGSGSLVVSLGFRMALVFTTVFAHNLTTVGLAKISLPRSLTLFSFMTIGFLVLFSGERDLLYRLVVVFFFIYYVVFQNQKLNKRTVMLGTLGVFSLPLLNKYKYFGLTGVTRSTYNSFVLNFITSDFVSASKNLQIILLDESTRGQFGGLTWLSAFSRALKLDEILQFEALSPIKWYNQTYFAPNRSGQGFSLVAEGYVNFGYFGIFILFMFVGFLVRRIYHRSNKGSFHFLFYVLSVPVFMYSIRADLANIISPLLWQNGLSLLFLKVVLDNAKTRSKEKGIPEVLTL